MREFRERFKSERTYATDTGQITNRAESTFRTGRCLQFRNSELRNVRLVPRFVLNVLGHGRFVIVEDPKAGIVRP